MFSKSSSAHPCPKTPAAPGLIPHFSPLTVSVTGTASGPATFSAPAFSSSAATVPGLLRNVRRECALNFSGSGFSCNSMGCQPLVIFRCVQVQRQTGIIYDKLDAWSRRPVQKIFHRGRAGTFQFHKCPLWQDYRMPGPPAKRRLANGIHILRGKFHQLPQSFHAQMRLVTENDRPVGNSFPPAIPVHRANDGTEHPAFRLRIFDAV